MPKKEEFNIGDMVKITMLGSIDLGKYGVVVNKIQYIRGLYDETEDPGWDVRRLHQDEYSCEVRLLDIPKSVMVRAKWLEKISKRKEKQDG